MEVIITNILSSLVGSLIAYLSTYLITMKKFKNEIIKDKLSKTGEAIKKLPYEICQIMNQINSGETMSREKVSEILSNVLCYGSKDAVAIAVKMQMLIYSMNHSEDKQIGYDALASYSLLITQIKYDLTSEIISPESLFQLKLTDYSDTRPQIVSSINKIVDELNLNKKFKVEL